MKVTFRAGFALWVLASFVACGGDNGPNPGGGSDAGVHETGDARPGDASAALDATAAGDATPQADATPGQDATPVGDAGPSADALPGQDASTSPDATLGPDTGPHPSPGICEPDPTQTGNANNVGAYCTAGGQECRQYTTARICAIDVDPSGGNFCIKLVCNSHDTCGEGACCTGRAGNPVKACVPKGCLVTDLADPCPPIPGTEDAGVGTDI